jgi:Family of unknown function (DUF6390)
VTSGAALFARYAYPPNALGYCGPADHETFLERAVAGEDDGLVELVGCLDSWPYLRLIADAAGIADPLDTRVVEAYWVGNELLYRVAASEFVATLERFVRARSGAGWDEIVRFVDSGAVPHHSFHVFAVYPWLRLLRTAPSPRPLEVLDRCRIRWGTVESVDGDSAIVRVRPLTWNGRALGVGPETTERVSVATEGRTFVRDVGPGDIVALHWGWVCDRLTSRRLVALRRSTALHLGIAAPSASSGRETETKRADFVTNRW